MFRKCSWLTFHEAKLCFTKCPLGKATGQGQVFRIEMSRTYAAYSGERKCTEYSDRNVLHRPDLIPCYVEYGIQSFLFVAFLSE